MHYASVVYEVGALLQIVLFETHLVPDDNDVAVPEQGESEAWTNAQDSIVPTIWSHFFNAIHPVVPFQIQFFVPSF